MRPLSGSSSTVEYEFSKLVVVGSNPIFRSILFKIKGLQMTEIKLEDPDELTPAFSVFLQKALKMLWEKKWRNENLQKTMEDTRLWVDTIVCPVCNFEYNFKETEAKPCDHLLALMDEWHYV
jgi:hypothetical protein